MDEFIWATPEEAKVMLLSANYDRTSSFGRGSDKGPPAILDCLENQIESWERFSGTEPFHSIPIGHQNLGDLNGLNPEDMVVRVKQAFSEWHDQGKFVILLGGEHSISNGPFQHLASSDITILQIDAHFDLRPDDSDYNPQPHGQFAHSAVMRRAHELGFKIVPVGIRAYHKDEFAFAKQQNITFFEWGRGPTPSVDEVMKAITTKKVYLTIDVDGIDPAHMPATGTPVQGGLEWYWTLQLIERICTEKQVVAADVVEVLPRPNDHLTEYGAAQIIYNIIAAKMKKT